MCHRIAENNHITICKDDVSSSPSIQHLSCGYCIVNILDECVKRWIIRKLCRECHYQRSGEYLLSFEYWNSGSHSLPTHRSFCDALKLVSSFSFTSRIDVHFQFDGSFLTLLLICVPVVFRFIPSSASCSEVLFLPTHEYYSIDQRVTTTSVPMTSLSIVHSFSTLHIE